MAGFVCCSAWENDSGWSTEQEQVAQASLTSQMQALRAHASGFLWAYGSDQPPTAAHLTQYKNIAGALHWQNPTLDNVATWSNSDAGMKMDGPYVWEPPVLWWDTTKNGSAFGTTGEEGTEFPAAAGKRAAVPRPGRPVAARHRLELPRGQGRQRLPQHHRIQQGHQQPLRHGHERGGLCSTGTVMSNNLYWYSTAVRTYANLTGLNSLASNTSLAATVSRSTSGEQQTATIRLTNNSATNLAFFVRPEVTAGNGGTEVVSVTYTDNYVSLWPGESTTITATYRTSDLNGRAPYLRVRGYNFPSTSTPIS
jgi:hypothetical protein